jgi:DNA polymerase-1
VENFYVEGNIDPLISEFARFNTFSLDIETSGLSPLDSRFLLVQIAFPDKAFVVNCANTDIHPILPFLSDTKWKKIIQNAKFDTKFFLYHYKTRTRNIFDTKLAENLILSDARHGSNLQALALKYLGLELDKSTRETFIDMKPGTIFTDEQLRYATQDAEILFRIMDKQKEVLESEGLNRVAEIEFELAPIVGDMELVGVPIDTKKWSSKIDEYRIKHEESRLKMHELLFDGVDTKEQLGMFVRDSINLNSPQQIKAAFAKIGIKLDATNERIIGLIDHPATNELLEYRGFKKILDAYGDSFLEKIHPFTGRIHTDWQQLGTETGRFSCKDPNFQQVPAEFRECVSSPDYQMVVADYANIELRILAELSDDERLVNAFTSGEDPHKSTAAIMFNIPSEDVTYEQRFIAKTINFGLAYGMQANKLKDILNKGKPKSQHMSFRRAQAIMEKHREAYRDVTRWLDQAGKIAYRRGYSETMMGRKRYFSRPEGGDREGQIAAIKRQGANSPIQGTNADITKLAILNLYEDLRQYNFRADIILQVHDEIGVLAHKSQAEAVKEVVIESMEKSAQEVLKKVPVIVDAYVNDEWKKG